MEKIFVIVLFFLLPLHAAILSLFYPQQEQLIERESYTMLYSSQHKQARWVIEKITKDNIIGMIKRSHCFKEDPMIFSPSVVTDGDYYHSGYDRGHMAAAANHKDSQKAMDETFFLTNITPQDPLLNRGAWREIEEYIRSSVVNYSYLLERASGTMLYT